MKQEFDFTLEYPISFHHDGEVRQAHIITLRAPSRKHSNLTAKLRQWFAQAIADMQSRGIGGDDEVDVDSDSVDEVEADEDVSIDDDETLIEAASAMNILLASNIDYQVFEAKFVKLITCQNPVICTVDGLDDVKMTQSIYETFNDSDWEKLVGEYIARFLVSSAMRS